MKNSISGKTQVVGLIGHPISHTFSPAMHNAAFAQMGLNFVYVPLPVQSQNIAAAVNGIRGLSLAGVNVTMPHKSSVMAHLDYVAPEAKLIGAVNTIVNENGVLKGYNTDAPGFLKSLAIDAGVTPKDKKVMLMGAGGAARAVSVQLALSGARQIVFTSPLPEEITVIKEIITGATDTLVDEVCWDEAEIAAHLQDVDILVNATPLGMHPLTAEMPPVRIKDLNQNALVYDLVYNPSETLLMRTAREHGIKAVNGLGMLLYQGALAFEKWAGLEPPINVMKDALESFVNQP